MDSLVQSGEYLPKVIRRIDYLHLDISDKPCDACGMWAEDHKWVVIDHSGSKVIYCSESPDITPIRNTSVLTGRNAGKVYV
jgi:alpha-D-ribose 1-methylphosphonate 5-phosphate C-P lyase